MSEGSRHEVIAEASDVDVASLVRRLWEARGYETALRFSGPDVHVEAVGETEEGVTRTVRTWVGADGASERSLRVFVDACERDEAEPHVVAVRGGVDRSDVPPGVPAFDASGLAVELREAGVEIGDGATAEAGANAEEREDTDWLGDPVEGDDGAGGGDDEGDGDEEIDRREAVTTVGKYVLGGVGLYLGVERLSEFVRSSPAVRTAVRRVADLRAHLPTVDLPSFEAGGTSANRSRVEEAVSTPQSPAGEDRPADATRVPYHELAADPAAFAGENVRYEGTVDAVREREETFEIRLQVTATAADEWTDAVACRWRVGALFDDAVSVHLLENETVTVWGVVRGETPETRYGRAVPLLAVLDVERTDG